MDSLGLVDAQVGWRLLQVEFVRSESSWLQELGMIVPPVNISLTISSWVPGTTSILLKGSEIGRGELMMDRSAGDRSGQYNGNY